VENACIWPLDIARMAAFWLRKSAFLHRLRDPAGAKVGKHDPASSGSLIGKGIGVMEGKIKGVGANSLQPIVRASVLPAHVENGHVQALPH